MTRHRKSSTPSEPRLAAGPPEGARGHLRFGFWALLVFLVLGAGLEALHGFKVQFYLAVDNEARRLLWTLAHAHGTLLSLINIVFGLSLGTLALGAAGRTVASRCLYGASVLIPAGFFFGGVFIHEGDPGLGIVLVPVGFLLLVVAVFLAARAVK